jgi:hypothetical protein
MSQKPENFKISKFWRLFQNFKICEASLPAQPASPASQPSPASSKPRQPTRQLASYNFEIV